VNVQLTKCWHAKGGVLVFLASVYDHQNQSRTKCYLIIDATSPEPIKISAEKPDFELKSDGLAALIRKYIPSGRISALTLSDQSFKPSYACFHIHSSKEQSSPFELYVYTDPDKMIELAQSGTSIARLTSSHQYTVKRPFQLEQTTAQPLSSGAFDFWIKQLLENGLSKDHENFEQPANASEFSQSRRDARDKISRRLRTLRKTFEESKQHTPAQNLVAETKKHANLLQQYLWMLKQGDFQLHLPEPHDGISVISVNPDLTPGGNVEFLFKKLRKLERAAVIQTKRSQTLSSDISKLEHWLEKLRDPLLTFKDSEITAILAECGLSTRVTVKSNTTKARPHRAGRLFIHPSGTRIILGRDAKESDQIVKGAASNDWWIHVAKGSHGSHVITSGPTVHKEISADIVRMAGILALHFSDRKQAKEGEVYLARRHQIRKTKDLAPGLWLISSAETRLIRYDDSDLSKIFLLEVRDGVQRETQREG
jgi:hypothetical protein